MTRSSQDSDSARWACPSSLGLAWLSGHATVLIQSIIAVGSELNSTRLVHHSVGHGFRLSAGPTPHRCNVPFGYEPLRCRKVNHQETTSEFQTRSDSKASPTRYQPKNTQQGAGARCDAQWARLDAATDSMADDDLLDKVHNLSDIELAVLLCLISREHCLISTPSEALNDLVGELHLVRTFKLRRSSRFIIS